MTQTIIPGLEIHRQPAPSHCLDSIEQRTKLMEAALEREREGWAEAAMEHLSSIASRFDMFTADDWRVECAKGGLSEPHHANCWGAVARRAIDSGVIEPTGEYVPSERPEARGRMIAVWRHG